MDTIKDRLKRVMEYYKLTPQTMAEKAGVTRQAIDLMLNGKTLNPKLSAIQNLASTLDGLNSDWLLKGEGNMLNKSIEPESSDDLLAGIPVSDELKENPEVQSIIKSLKHKYELKVLEVQIKEAEANYYKKLSGR